jgi:hypothetical protein
MNAQTNSIQLYRRDGRWWVSSILWTRESEEARIPAEYLPRAADPVPRAS